MSEMVEKVARAMAAAIVSQVRSGATFEEMPSLMICDEDSNSFWELMPVARAAIEAMREPTQAMVDAGDDVSGSLAITHDYSARNTWQTMIDAALDQDGRVKR